MEEDQARALVHSVAPMARCLSRTQFVRNEIEYFVNTNPPGTTFTVHNLYLCGPTHQISRILATLAQRGQIRRVSRGVYQP